MKKLIYIVTLISLLSASSCKKDLLIENDPSKLSAENYFTKVSDATTALYGAYSGAREAFFKPYAWDGPTDMMYSRINARPYTYNPNNSLGSAFSRHWNDLYKTINRCNFVIVNTREMIARETLPANITELQRVVGEALFLRSMAYFRLIDLWGDVPYYENILSGNDEAYSLSKTAKATIKDKILADLDLAVTYVPITVVKAQQGRATRAAVYGYRGKIKLYWANWMKNAGNTAEANTYFAQAASDFEEVMKPTYGRTLYKGGASGTATAPFYQEMFDGDQSHEDAMYSSEAIFAFTSGAGFGFVASDVSYGDTYLYDFGTRSTGAGGGNVQPHIRLVNRYQLISTGTFAPPILLLNPNTNADARTRTNSALNPATFAGRDYRCFSTIMWDGSLVNEVTADGTVTATVFINQFKQTAPPYQFSELPVTGFMYRKYIRQISGFARENGPQDSWMMRLPDVWLMYAEATNEVSGPTGAAFDLLDRIRTRSGLPPLVRGNFTTRVAFFDAIEQERIVELAAEGSRFFDIRRWKKVEQIWPQPNGYPIYNTWNEFVRDEFRNAVPRDFERYYLFQIPPTEILNNPKLIQNDPWL
ncbi:MAG: RagB/SusD family nutrient uptake outer membrane protein [Flavobacteriales bacterium]|nr:MAG: RagB/SusD family nutrient uptake outer membrane protein [Flavobacteriales bacterium]